MRHVWSRIPRDQFRPNVTAEYRCRHCEAVRFDREQFFSNIRYIIVDGIETIVGPKGSVFPPCPARIAKGTREIPKLKREPRMVNQPKKRKIKESFWDDPE